MTFNEISLSLLQKENCAILINTQDGAVFIEDLHKVVKLSVSIVAKCSDPRNNHIAIATKEQLKQILTNYDKARIMPVGSKRPR